MTSSRDSDWRKYGGPQASRIYRYCRTAVVGILWVCSGCGVGKDALAPALPASQLLARLQLDNNVYNMALASPYDTVQLHATGYSGTGQVIKGVVQYTVALSSQDQMTVTPAGLLKVLSEGTNAVVRAQMTYNGVTLADSAYVNVIAGAPTQFLKRLKFELSPQDSAKVAMGMIKTISILRTDSTNASMSGLGVRVWVSDSTIVAPWFFNATDSTLSLLTHRPGHVFVYVSTYAYGVSVRDSMEFQAGLPLYTNVEMFGRLAHGSSSQLLDFYPGRATIGIGGCIIWRNSTSTPIDVIFDDSSAVESAQAASFFLCQILGGTDMNGGNIAPFQAEKNANGQIVSGQRVRAFTHPGTYPYHSQLYGTTGVVVVCDEKNDPKCTPDDSNWLVVQ